MLQSDFLTPPHQFHCQSRGSRLQKGDINVQNKGAKTALKKGAMTALKKGAITALKKLKATNRQIVVIRQRNLCNRILRYLVRKLQIEGFQDVMSLSSRASLHTTPLKNVVEVKASKLPLCHCGEVCYLTLVLRLIQLMTTNLHDRLLKR